MARANTSQIDELAPESAYQTLSITAHAAVIDARIQAEPVFTRRPVLSANAKVVEEDLDRSGDGFPEHLIYSCRAGARSRSRASGLPWRQD